QSVIHPKLGGLCVPKTETAAELRELDRQVAALEGQRGIPVGATGFVAFLETARGILNVQEIASASPRMIALTLGAEDFTLDMGIARTEEAAELFFPRCQIALAAAAVRIKAIDTVYTDLGNEDGLRRETRLIKSLGFHGKLAIHPKQVQPIHQAFAPSEAEVAYARRILQAFGEAQGTGVIAVDGKMVDEPVVAKARGILQLAEID
ncbi:MAG: CoA ester lyase, partial [Chloroflexi bacterium]|nr:CoA ester lyase [Chloroflexota bacterium]